MARQPRLDLPGVPQHIVQRGNNRLPCFLDDEDRARHRQLLREALLASDCRLRAYVLMDRWSSCASLCGLRDEALLTRTPSIARSASRATAPCWPRRSAPKTWPQSASTCNSNALTAAMPSARW